ncbi:hypothetical protein [Vibrio sinaloensis]|uniref:hypothetical protein n=1 Tax=Photobacterium sp. (strain ATCC 43367) TaxID=379097 RepID=UPI0035F0D7F2
MIKTCVVLLGLFSALAIANPNVRTFELDSIKEYLDICSPAQSAICVNELFYFKEKDEFFISLKINQSMLSDDLDNDPLYNLKVTMSVFLLLFNSDAARDYGIISDFIDLKLPEIDQRKVVILAELFSGNERYIGFYKKLETKGAVAYDVKKSDLAALDFYLERTKYDSL